MDKKFFNTLVKSDTEDSYTTQYVVGRISGFMHILCNGAESKRGGMRMREEGWYLGVQCTQEEYNRFAEYVETQYPGLCVFDTQMG